MRNKMQPYKKRLKPYLYLSTVLSILGFALGNFFDMLEGYDMTSKIYFLFSGDLNKYISENCLAFFYRPSFLAFILAFFAFLCGLLIYVSVNDPGTYRNGEEHGSGRYATPAEMKKYADKDPENDMILSQNVRVGLFNERLPQKVQKNKNVACLGDSGSAKTLAFVKTNLMQMNSSFVVTDPDGGIVHEVGKMLEDNGYKIKILDLNTLTNSDTFNVFEYIKTEIDVDRVLEQITEGTKKSDFQGEDFWQKAEALLIRSLIAYLWFDGQDNNYTPHIGMIADMLRFVKRHDRKALSVIEQWFEEQNISHPSNYAYKQWTLFNDLYESETRASVLGIAAARYSVFDHDVIVDMVKRDTMEIEKWNTEKTAVFIAIPETNDSYNFIASMFLATVMETLRAKSDAIRLGREKLKSGNKLLHVRFLIDEFANIGKIPNFAKALATFRKRNMSFAIILQGLEQLKEMYPKGWGGILNNCASLLFLGGDEENTTAYLSKRAGKQTISIKNHSHQYGARGGGSENNQKQARDLITPDEIAKLGGDECLVYITREHVFKDKKAFAYNHPKAHLLGKEPGDENWYNYKRYKDDMEELLDLIRENPESLIEHEAILSDAA